MTNQEKAQENYENAIRRFTTCDLLEYFSRASIEAYNDNKRAFTIVDVPYYNCRTGEKGMTKGFNYGQWDLVQICYNSIKYSNDYRGRKVDESSFYYLLNENKIYEQALEELISTDPIYLYEHLQCITNIQFDFQSLTPICRFNRMYHIFTNINQNKNYNQTNEVCYINFEQKFKEITNIDYNKFILIYSFIVLLSAGRNKTNIYDLINDIQFDVEKLGFSKEDIIAVIELQSRDYSFYKKSNNWNLLKFYPIVKTDKGTNKYIITNIFSLMLSFPDAAYWIIRNYYAEKNSNDFTNYFGICFENYLKEVLECYNINHLKLSESKKQKIKVPDWKIETDNYIFLVEQKAALFPIDTRTITKEERYKKIEEYFDKTLIKAFKQLNSYEINDTNKTVIRICLTFERIYMEENAKYIVERKMDFKTDKNLNWIVNIDEFEILMELLHNNEEKFNQIIQEKINLEVTQDKNGRNFGKILGGYKYNYTSKEINHFDKIMDYLKSKLKDN